MAVKIQIRRGTKAGLPTLAQGEYGLAIDTGELFVGGETGNLQVSVLGSDGKIPGNQLPAMDYDPSGTAAAAVAAHNISAQAHADIRAAVSAVQGGMVSARALRAYN